MVTRNRTLFQNSNYANSVYFARIFLQQSVSNFNTAISLKELALFFLF